MKSGKILPLLDGMVHMEKNITIIVPVYKINEEYLKKCVGSIINQTNPNWRAIFIDDGSPDNCGQILDDIAEKEARIKVIHQENAGVSLARNKGIQESETEWIMFVDPDDWVSSELIEKISEIISINSNADIIMFDYCREFNDKSLYESLKENSTWVTGTLMNQVRKSLYYKLVQGNKTNPYAVPAIWNKVYRKSFLEKNEINFLPNAKKGQDRLFNAKALMCTSSIYYFHELLYYYRCSETSVTNRYNTNIVELTKIEINELYRLLNKYENKYEYIEYFYCRICTRLYSCMRLYFFNEKNDKSYKVTLEEIKKIINDSPFKEALENIDFSLLNGQERIFVFCIKFKLLHLCKILVTFRTRKYSKLLK